MKRRTVGAISKKIFLFAVFAMSSIPFVHVSANSLSGVTVCSSADTIVGGDPVTITVSGYGSSCSGTTTGTYYPTSSTTYSASCTYPDVIGGGLNAEACVTVTVLEPTCGNTAADYSLPSPLCTVGVARNVSSPAGGPFTWTCGNDSGTRTVSCSKPRKVNALCGDAENYKHAFAFLEGGGVPCFGGSTSPTWVPTNSTPSNLPLDNYEWTWTCFGLNGGANSPLCSAPRIANGVCATPPSSDPPTSDSDPVLRDPSNPPVAPLCADGEPQPGAPFDSGPDYAEPNNQWYWSCTGQNDGITANCSAWCAFQCHPELHCDTETEWLVRNACGKVVRCSIPTGGTRTCNLNWKEVLPGL